MRDSTVGSTLAMGGSTTEQVKDQVKENAQDVRSETRQATTS